MLDANGCTHIPYDFEKRPQNVIDWWRKSQADPRQLMMEAHAMWVVQPAHFIEYANNIKEGLNVACEIADCFPGRKLFIMVVGLNGYIAASYIFP